MDANIKTLRDALEWLDRNIEEEAVRDGEMSNENAIRAGFIRSTLGRFPLRNCDVGTPEDQAQRFHAFCHNNRTFYTACSDDCPFKDMPDINHCMCGWGQLPYEAPATHGEEE